jgi:hypothetical protein
VEEVPRPTLQEDDISVCVADAPRSTVQLLVLSQSTLYQQNALEESANKSGGDKGVGNLIVPEVEAASEVDAFVVYDGEVDASVARIYPN